MEDLAVVYRFVMESSEDGRASILVTNNLMDRMGVSHEQDVYKRQVPHKNNQMPFPVSFFFLMYSTSFL